jgi:hypothetical protein
MDSFFVRLNASTLYCSCFEEIDALFNNVQLDQTSVPLLGVLDGIKLALMQTIP